MGQYDLELAQCVIENLMRCRKGEKGPGGLCSITGKLKEMGYSGNGLHLKMEKAYLQFGGLSGVGSEELKEEYTKFMGKADRLRIKRSIRGKLDGLDLAVYILKGF